MYTIDCFTAETPHGKSPWTKQIFFSHSFCSPRPNLQDKICHMFASEHPEVVEGRWRFIATDVIDSEEADKDVFIDNGGTALDEEYESGSVEVGLRTGVTQSGTEDVEDVQRVVKYYFLSSYMWKPPSLLTQVFNKNKTAQENIFKHICNFRARSERGN